MVYNGLSYTINHPFAGLFLHVWKMPAAFTYFKKKMFYFKEFIANISGGNAKLISNNTSKDRLCSLVNAI